MRESADPTLALACELIRRPSLTPDDAGCQDVLIQRLQTLGFTIQRLPYGKVSNFWAQRGSARPLLVWAGHTDVVPAGPLEQWQSPPFEPTVREGYLYGRGAADMKGSLAAMITACERFITTEPNHKFSIGFLITSDEEGPALDGTAKVMEWLQGQGLVIDACLLGEPSSHQRLGDALRHGRRGSLSGRLGIQGVQGHVAYPKQARNPIHAVGSIIDALAGEIWDRGNDFFPPTSFQISNIHAGTGADNVVPGAVDMQFNFRFCTESTVESLQARTQHIIDTCLANEEIRSGQHFTHHLEWRLAGQPFVSEPGLLVAAVSAAVNQECGYHPELSTAGGTSDGRFIAPTGAEVVELGPVNASIHQVNERVAVADLSTLSRVYEQILIPFSRHSVKIMV
jgi:succinyl-diaminopimelate desuccinylase